MLDNTLIPLYQERVTSLTFNTEHTSEQFWLDDDDEDAVCRLELKMTGVGREAGQKGQNKKTKEVFRVGSCEH